MHPPENSSHYLSRFIGQPKGSFRGLVILPSRETSAIEGLRQLIEGERPIERTVVLCGTSYTGRRFIHGMADYLEKRDNHRGTLRHTHTALEWRTPSGDDVEVTVRPWGMENISLDFDLLGLWRVDQLINASEVIERSGYTKLPASVVRVSEEGALPTWKRREHIEKFRRLYTDDHHTVNPLEALLLP